MARIETDISLDHRQPKIEKKDNHPEAIKGQKKAKSKDLSKFIAMIDEQIEDMEAKRSKWKERQVRFYKQRFGIRPRKTFPWPGSSNQHIYTIDKSIRKILPLYVKLALPPDLCCEFKSPSGAREGLLDQITAQQGMNAPEFCAQMLDHLIREKMTNMFKEIVLTGDKMLHHGFVPVKITYEFREITKEYVIDLDLLPENRANIAIQHKELALEKYEKALTEWFVLELGIKGHQFDFNNKKQMEQMKKAIGDFRKGKTRFVFKFEKVVAHAPKYKTLKPENLLVHSCFNEVEEAELICHEMKITPNRFRQLAQSGKIDAEVAEEILTKFKTRKGKEVTGLQSANMERAQLDLHGVNSYDVEDLIRIREVCCYAQPDKSGIYRRCILTYSPELKTKALKFVLLPYDDNEWPYEKIRLDITDDGWYGHRGIPAKLDYYSVLINVTNNDMIDHTKLMVPMLEYVVGNVNMSNLRYIPGQGVPVTQLGSVQEIRRGSAHFPNLLERLRFYKYEVEDYISSPDFTLTDPNAPSAGARTATEILTKAQDREMVFDLDANIFLNDWAKVLKKIWNRWLQYGEEEYELKVTGKKNPIRWTKEMGQSGLLPPRPVSSAQDVNPVLRARQYEMFMNLLHSEITRPSVKVHPTVMAMAKMIAPRSHGEFVHNQEEMDKLQQMMAANMQKQKQEGFMLALNQKKLEYQHDKDMEKLKGENRIAEVFAKAKVDKKTGKDKDAKKAKGNNSSSK